MGKPAGRWYTPATRGVQVVARPERSVDAHVYIGVFYCGVPSLKCVTGTYKTQQIHGLADGCNRLAIGLLTGKCSKIMLVHIKLLPTWHAMLAMHQEVIFWPGHSTDLPS